MIVVLGGFQFVDLVCISCCIGVGTLFSLVVTLVVGFGFALV